MMAMTRDSIPPNLANLHSAEEQLRQKARGMIADDPRLQLHLAVTEAAMDLADMLRQFNSSDENLKVAVLLGMRTFNAFAASIKLALSGYPHLAGHFARVITHQTGAYAQTLIDDFSKKTKAPHIAISVDMLDTGIDVPEVLNLVFFKQVRSKTKFWQMMGRGTRLCPDLFGPGQDKEFFRVFDYCQNLEFFGANPELKEAGTAKSLSERLFAARIDLVRALDEKEGKTDGLGRAPCNL
jgi:hypothetical protein